MESEEGVEEGFIVAVRGSEHTGSCDAEICHGRQSDLASRNERVCQLTVVRLTRLAWTSSVARTGAKPSSSRRLLEPAQYPAQHVATRRARTDPHDRARVLLSHTFDCALGLVHSVLTFLYTQVARRGIEQGGTGGCVRIQRVLRVEEGWEEGPSRRQVIRNWHSARGQSCSLPGDAPGLTVQHSTQTRRERVGGEDLCRRGFDSCECGAGRVGDGRAHGSRRTR